MKKIFIVFLSIAMTLVLFTACQATPEKPVVIQKDMEQMIEKAGSTDVQVSGKTLRERTGAPETFVMNGSYGALTLAADAPVVLPGAYKMSIFDVHSTVFSQETVDKYWNALVGDRQMWELSDQPTKADIEQMIVNQRQMQSTAEQEGNDTEAYDEIIAELEKLYQTAPDTAKIETMTSQLKEKVNWDPVLGTIDTRYMGISGSSVKSQANLQNTKGWIFFSASNPWTGEEGSIKSDTSPATIHFEAPAINNNYHYQIAIDENTVPDASVAALLKMTPKEAKQKVEEFLSKTDTPMEVYSMSLLSGTDQAAGKQAQHYAYEVTCIHKLDNGLSVCAPPKGSPSNIMPPGYLPKSVSPVFSSSWTYEQLVIQLNDDGFFQITWQSPLEITGIEVENSSLLPFEDIKGVFEKMLYASYEPNIQDGYTMTCNVSQVGLEMMRIRKQNSDPNALEGLLIPIWNFYGQFLIYNSGSKVVGGTMENATILSINAIDGSIIDPQQEY